MKSKYRINYTPANSSVYGVDCYRILKLVEVNNLPYPRSEVWEAASDVMFSKEQAEQKLAELNASKGRPI